MALKVDFNPQLARSLASEVSASENAYSLGRALGDKGYFPGKYAAKGLGGALGFAMSSPDRIRKGYNKLSTNMIDDKGLFQGGRQNRLFGRFRDEMGDAYQKGLMGAYNNKSGSFDVVPPKNTEPIQTGDDFLYDMEPDMNLADQMGYDSMEGMYTGPSTMSDNSKYKWNVPGVGEITGNQIEDSLNTYAPYAFPPYAFAQMLPDSFKDKFHYGDKNKSSFSNILEAFSNAIYGKGDK
tara:strand:+ start:694 stop:1407 length:714 start_codon:yes stop_codon:yes gene_type:complete